MAKYKVLSNLYRGVLYGVGSTIELEDGDFQPSLIGEVLELISESLPVTPDEQIPDPATQEESPETTEAKKKTRKAEAD